MASTEKTIAIYDQSFDQFEDLINYLGINFKYSAG